MDSATGPHIPTAPEDKTQRQPKSESDLTGQRLGDFQILRRLGEGGMGQVYLAEQKSLNRKVALKVLRSDLAANKTALARFEAEAKAVAQATHANIVQVYAFDKCDDLHYMALEYVEGRNLRQYLEKKGPPELMLALSIIRQVAAALQRASELGIIHRDIKPENILLTRKGEVKVADFGLSRIFGDERQPLNLTQSGVTMGTPLYMSPEQVEGKAVDPRTDIYSFGVTCYHLLSGQPPFHGQTAFEVAVQHVQKQPQPLAEIRPDLPADLCNLVHKMMAKNPDERIQTGREIVRELIRLRDNLVGMASTGGSIAMVGNAADVSSLRTLIVQKGPVPTAAALDAVRTQSLPMRRHWGGALKWLAALSVLLALAGGLGYGWWRAHDQAQQNQPGDGTAQAKRDPLLEVAPVKPASGANPEDQWLLEAIRKYAKDENNLQWMRARIDLGVFYLKEWRLDDADKVFKDLADVEGKGKQQHFHKVGLLGRAIVMAFRDQYRESNDQFKKLLKPADGGKNASFPLWQNHPGLGEMVARALDHNYANAPQEFPELLQKFRVPPPAVRKG